MRFLSNLKNDIRYQMKYGFYFLYAFFTALYIAILLICPDEYKKQVASIIVLTDPAMLGCFFIGAIWLLEKGEGLHNYWSISPLQPIEYILSKAVSLAIISTVSADFIVFIGLSKVTTDYFILSMSVFTGSMIFTTLGMFIASYARSVNHYMLLVSPLEIFVTLPPVLAIFGVTHPLLDMLPSTVLLRAINHSFGVGYNTAILMYSVLFFWLGITLLFSVNRISRAIQANGGDKV